MRSLIDAAIEDQERRLLATEGKTLTRRRSSETYGGKVQCAAACGKWTYTSMIYASRAFAETQSWTCRSCRDKR